MDSRIAKWSMYIGTLRLASVMRAMVFLINLLSFPQEAKPTIML